MLSENKLLDWVKEVHKQAPDFLSLMAVPSQLGGFQYAYRADILPVSAGRHGLANTVFAVKVIQTVNAQNMLAEKKDELASFIMSFFDKNTSEIADRSIRILSIPKRFVSRFGTHRLIYKDIRRAETRQAYATLLALGQMPDTRYMLDMCSKEKIVDFFNSLNWNNPWAAGSHLCHCAFFIRLHRDSGNISEECFQELGAAIADLLKTIENDDGTWGENVGNLTINQKVNGIMKILLALDSLYLRPNHYEGIMSMIEKALDAPYGACDNLNLIFVVYFYARYVDMTKMRERMSAICFKQLDCFRQHYHQKYGGFSFYLNRCNTFYFGAPVAFPRNTPDIHATSLYLWGIALILEFLGIRKESRYNLPIT